MRQPPPTPGRTSPKPAGRARHGVGEEAADGGSDGDAAESRRERAEQRRAADRKALTRGRGGPLHGLTVPRDAPLLHGRAGRVHAHLHESPVRRMSPVGRRDHDRAQPAVVVEPPHRHVRRRPSRRARSAGSRPRRWRMPAHLDGVRRGQQAGPHRGVVPGDEERPRAERARRGPRRATRAASRRGGRARRARASGRARARLPLDVAASRSTTPSADRPSPCGRAASGPSGSRSASFSSATPMISR